MSGRYRPRMAQHDSNSFSLPPIWSAARPPRSEVEALQAKVNQLEQQIKDYESLLSELPDLFERKFQQRLEPLLERYRLLAQSQQLMDAPSESKAIPLPLRADVPFQDVHDQAA